MEKGLNRRNNNDYSAERKEKRYSWINSRLIIVPSPGSLTRNAWWMFLHFRVFDSILWASVVPAFPPPNESATSTKRKSRPCRWMKGTRRDVPHFEMPQEAEKACDGNHGIIGILRATNNVRHYYNEIKCQALNGWIHEIWLISGTLGRYEWRCAREFWFNDFGLLETRRTSTSGRNAFPSAAGDSTSQRNSIIEHDPGSLICIFNFLISAAARRLREHLSRSFPMFAKAAVALTSPPASLKCMFGWRSDQVSLLCTISSLIISGGWTIAKFPSTRSLSM